LHTIFLSLVQCETYGIIKPPVSVVPYGRTIVLKCFSDSRALWSYRNPLKRVIGATYQDNTLYLPSASAKHGGIYMCTGNYPNRTQFIAKSLVYTGSKY